MIEQSCPLEKGDVRVIRDHLHYIRQRQEMENMSDTGKRESLMDKHGKRRASLGKAVMSPAMSPKSPSSPRQDVAGNPQWGIMMDAHDMDMMDFPEYLLLMHRVLSDNIANIKGVCDQNA